MLGILDFFAKIQDWIQYYRNIGSNTAAGLPQEKNAAWVVDCGTPGWSPSNYYEEEIDNQLSLHEII